MLPLRAVHQKQRTSWTWPETLLPEDRITMPPPYPMLEQNIEAAGDASDGLVGPRLGP